MTVMGSFTCHLVCRGRCRGTFTDDAGVGADMIVSTLKVSGLRTYESFGPRYQEKPISFNILLSAFREAQYLCVKKHSDVIYKWKTVQVVFGRVTYTESFREIDIHWIG